MHHPPTLAPLSRWIRCLFTLASPAHPTICESLLDQVLQLLSSDELPLDPLSAPYPQLELEYLATTTFNRAIDFYCAGGDENDTRCRDWMERALGVAEFVDDGDVLGGLLRGKMGRLVWEG
jgi:hypothetical protein